jgi:2-dehydropantoate 2-reductase
MHILVIGAGAIGGFIGGQLAAQHNVTLFDRAPLVEAVRARGLRIITPESEHTVTNLAAFTSLEEIFAQAPRFDLAIISMKAFDTVTAIKSLRPYADRIERFLTPQNGIDNEELLGAAFDRSKIISGTVLNPIAVPEIGVVKLEKAGRGLGLAPVKKPIDPYVDVIRATQLPVRVYADYRAMKWSKLILNLIGNATSAILDMPTRETYADERVFKIEVAMLREALAVMRAQSIGVVDLPGSPVRLLAFGIRFAPQFILKAILQPMVGGGRGDKPPSLLVDMRSGRTQSEIDALNGAIVKAGKTIGRPTPVNAALVNLVHDLLEGKADRAQWRRNIDQLVELTRA